MPEVLDPISRDFYEERRRKWRRSAFWRGFLVAAVIAGVIALFGSGGPDVVDENRARVGHRAHHRRPEARRDARAHRRGRPGQGGRRSDQLARRHHGRIRGALRLAADGGREEAGRRGDGRARGVRRLHRRDRRRPYRRTRQHSDRLDRRDHGVSGPDPGDGAARDRARDGSIVGAQGRALAVPADQPGGAGGRGGAGRRGLRLVPRPRRRAARARGGGARPGGERRGLHRAAGARQRADRRNRR